MFPVSCHYRNTEIIVLVPIIFTYLGFDFCRMDSPMRWLLSERICAILKMSLDISKLFFCWNISSKSTGIPVCSVHCSSPRTAWCVVDTKEIFVGHWGFQGCSYSPQSSKQWLWYWANITDKIICISVCHNCSSLPWSACWWG